MSARIALQDHDTVTATDQVPGGGRTSRTSTDDDEVRIHERSLNSPYVVPAQAPWSDCA